MKNGNEYIKNWKEKDKMINYIKTNKINNFAEFTDWCILNNYEWFKLLVDYPNLYKYLR